MTIKFLFIFAIAISVSYSQETIQHDKLSSMYNEAMLLSQKQDGELSSEKPIKCGFGIKSEVKTHFSSFTPEQQQNLLKILQRPALQTSILSPSGHFRIHYDTTGTNAPHYDTLTVQQSVDSVAAAADSAYNFEVGYLGYPPAPPDFGAGGDNSYDIYIENLHGSEYGETDPDSPISVSDSTWTAYTIIDNAYSSQYFPTIGLNGAKVTVAHEYHHGIQVGNYILRYDLDAFFYELTSVSMETFVYKTIPDYLNYLPDYFNDPSNAFGCITCGNGNQEYALGIWNIFLQKQFGYDIIKKQWELMPKMRAMYAINEGLNEYGSSFKKEFTIFSSWLYFTNKRSITGKYFPNAKYYPLLTPYTTISFNSSHKNLVINSSPTAQNFIMFVNPANNDTLAVFITNDDLKSGINSIYSTTPFTYDLYNYYQSGTINLSDKYYSKFVVDNSILWGETEILNNEVVNQDTSSPVATASITYAYPNPFYYSKNSFIDIPVSAKLSDLVYLNIYSVSMHLVYSGDLAATVGRGGNVAVEWDGRKTNGGKLASGVYIYLTKNGDNTTSGKIVIFNE